MKTLVLIGVNYTPRQKTERLLSPDRVFLIYTGLSWIMKIFLNIFPGPNILDKLIRMELTFYISLFLTFVFIIYCYIRQVDWYGKQTNAVISSFRKWTQERKWTNFLFFPFLFVADPFLFFIYLRNGSKNIAWQAFAWLLLSSSLLSNSFILMKVGNAFLSIF